MTTLEPTREVMHTTSISDVKLQDGVSVHPGPLGEELQMESLWKQARMCL